MNYKLTNWYRRWRHGRGFGVHSPFAYRLVREVLCPARDVAYYAYDDIARMRRRYGSAIAYDELCLIYRILVEFGPKTIAICANHPAHMLHELARLACPAASIVESSPADFLLVEGTAHVPVHTASAYFTDATNPAVASIWEGVPAGHLYRNGTRALIALHNAPRQIFEVKF